MKIACSGTEKRDERFQFNWAWTETIQHEFKKAKNPPSDRLKIMKEVFDEWFRTRRSG